MKTTLVVTTINGPTKAMLELRDGARAAGWDFIIVGDAKTPKDFVIEGANFIPVGDQIDGKHGSFGTKVDALNHYARKNVGYVAAARAGAELIVETDDDNHPRPAFFDARPRKGTTRVLLGTNWDNVYRHFTADHIWPRGLPLTEIDQPHFPFVPTMTGQDCPIQQDLADGDPDVDAIYRLTVAKAVFFKHVSIALGGVWAPFNSQATAWFKDVFPLLYLPVTCAFRATDIWRSFVAQRVVYSYGQRVLFRGPNVYQTRNPHNLQADFDDEISMYVHNDQIMRELDALTLDEGTTVERARHCWSRLIELGHLRARELSLFDAFIEDVSRPILTN